MSTPAPDVGASDRPDPGAVAAVAVAIAAGVAVAIAALLAGRPTWWFADDWNSFAMYADGSPFQPFNGHLSVLPALLFRTMYQLVGMEHYWPYRVMALVAIAALSVAAGRLVMRHLGAPAAALVVAAIVWNSAGASNLLFPFLVNFTLPLLALVMVWWYLDRGDRRGDVLAAIWLAVALASSGLGLLVLVAVSVELLVERAPRRRWATMAPGPALWLAWYLLNRDASRITTDPGKVVSYGVRMLAGGLRSLAAGWAPGGLAVGLVLLALVVGAVRVAGWRQGRLWAAVTVPATFIVLTSLTRVETIPAIPPDELRYAWTIAVGLVFVGVVAATAWRDAASRDAHQRSLARPARALAVVWAAAIVAGSPVLWSSMRDWSDMVAASSPGIRSNLYAVEAIGPDRVDRSHVLPLSFEPVTSGAYLDAVAAVGSPMQGTTAAQLGGSAQLRSAADRQLVDQLPIRLDSIDSARGASCTHPVHVDEVPPGSVLVVRTPAGDPPVPVRIARLAADDDAIELGSADAAGAVVTVPDDAPGSLPTLVPYRIVVDPAARVVACR